MTKPRQSFKKSSRGRASSKPTFTQYGVSSLKSVKSPAIHRVGLINNDETNIEPEKSVQLMMQVIKEIISNAVIEESLKKLATSADPILDGYGLYLWDRNEEAGDVPDAPLDDALKGFFSELHAHADPDKIFIDTNIYLIHFTDKLALFDALYKYVLNHPDLKGPDTAEFKFDVETHNQPFPFENDKKNPISKIFSPTEKQRIEEYATESIEATTRQVYISSFLQALKVQENGLQIMPYMGGEGYVSKEDFALASFTKQKCNITLPFGHILRTIQQEEDLEFSPEQTKYRGLFPKNDGGYH